jgi:hypothetical protein
MATPVAPFLTAAAPIWARANAGNVESGFREFSPWIAVISRFRLAFAGVFA